MLPKTKEKLVVPKNKGEPSNRNEIMEQIALGNTDGARLPKIKENLETGTVVAQKNKGELSNRNDIKGCPETSST